MKRLVVVGSLVLLLPAAVRAQSSITGTVRDTSGAVLPGVTIEAASPALIEKVRTAVTDGQGVYRIVDLRPGPYTVTFTLQGFNTFRRTGIELRAEFAATVDAELMLGTVEETITVTGEAPLVDTRSARAQTQYAAETLQALPGTGRLSTHPWRTKCAAGHGRDEHGNGGVEHRRLRLELHELPGSRGRDHGHRRRP
ncbi:MAG: carboxypeptidase regulatory-like domain-containing protein [Acidobacteria bacterium]|nr:carboxypeptidase regulatory-like domain-containing protein [Acidobacteriota bacterium]